MKKLFKTFGILIAVFFMTQAAFAEEYKVLVLPDNLQFESTNYYIYPDASTMFASDAINYLNKSGKIKTVSMTAIRDSFRKSQKIQQTAKSVLKEFKYNNNIPFVDLKTVAKYFDTNKVLLITSTTDIQNYLMRRTVWDILNVPGAAVIDPAYAVSTYVALVDVDKEIVLWQKRYQKLISSPDNTIIAVNFAPALEQLDKLKFYSQYIISPEISNMTEYKILPPPMPITSVKGDIIQTTNPVIFPLSDVQSKLETEIKTKPFTPTKPRMKSQTVIINDL